jgi:predicted NAD/FAD-binding protein
MSNLIKKKIAIIGSGISGLTSAHYLQSKYDVTVFEKSDYIGGHTATKTVKLIEGTFRIDTGFIVFNNWTYPNFIRLLNDLGVSSNDTEMGFSVSCDASGLEYSGGSFGTLFAQKKNYFSIKHWRLIFDILKFNRAAKQRLATNKFDESMTINDFIVELKLSEQFKEKYLIPMGAAIWSSGLTQMCEFPALYFLRFFKNHGLLNIMDRPQWKVIKDGSNSYVEKLLHKSQFIIKKNTNVISVQSKPEAVEITVQDSTALTVHKFDHVILACHSDQALELLIEATPEQNNVLSKLTYSNNEVVLHTDVSLLPANRSTWSSWNYRIRSESTQLATLSYSMNILQGINSNTQFIVTLNDTANIDPKNILGIYQYSHPVYNRGTILGQSLRSEINGKNNVWFCGAYWYSGFHEDGVRSALDVVKALGVDIDILTYD